jgi:hypothetical protein
MLVARLTLPLGKMVGVMVQARPSAKVCLLGLPLDTSITPKSLLFGSPADCGCLEQPLNANMMDAQITSGLRIFMLPTSTTGLQKSCARRDTHDQRDPPPVTNASPQPGRPRRLDRRNGSVILSWRSVQ